MFEVSVVYILRPGLDGDEVLLGEKLTGLGAGKVVGPGGKQEPGETPVETAVREVREEVGLTLARENLVPLARITYPFVGRPELSQRSHAFIVRDWSGELRASDEIAPTWWAIRQLPVDRMWSDAALWLPRALVGEFVEATFEIGETDQVLSQQMVWTARESV
jgi:8-oxo-dGTP pyrophosphatase MutT (NUDIX family)